MQICNALQDLCNRVWIADRRLASTAGSLLPSSSNSSYSLLKRVLCCRVSATAALFVRHALTRRLF